MSRSRKKAPFTGFTTAESDQPWKAQVARKTRRAVNQKLGATRDGDALPVKRYATANPYDAPKDGKQRLDDPASKYLRK